MGLDINTSIDFLKNRVDKTLSVQRQIAATWTWPIKTVAEWEADSTQLDKSQPDTAAATAIAATTRADGVRGQLDQRLATIHAQTLAVVGVMRVRAERAPEHRHVVDELSARGNSRKEIEDEAAALLSAWKEEFGPNFAPAPEITFDGFKALLFGDATANPKRPSLRDLKQALSDAATVERREVGRVSVLLTRVERDAVDWYAEATSIYGEATEIGALLRAEIPTTSDYNPATPAQPKPAQPTPAPAPAPNP
jgi:hypothetical protein